MPICIECRYPVNQLYTTYSAADDRSLGKGVRLTQCPRCKRFADKYVEHDFVVLFIDLVLIKPQVELRLLLVRFHNDTVKVYRHLLFNRLGREDDKFDVSPLFVESVECMANGYLTKSHLSSALVFFCCYSTSTSHGYALRSRPPHSLWHRRI